MKKFVVVLVLACGVAVAQNSSQAQAQAMSEPGAVFAATNYVKHNEVVMYGRSETGALKLIGSFATGGRGEGGINDPLQSQSSIALTKDHSFLLAVNAGSSNISVFQVSATGLTLLDKRSSEGGNPVSIAIHDDLVYVANVGGTYHTAGFRLKPWGGLEFIKNSLQPLSSLDTEPGTIAFSPDGSKLIVTERQTSKIDVFSVASDGSLSNPVVNGDQGVEPFGASFAPSGALLVSEAGSGAVSSYTINPNNTLSVITSKAPAGGGATCWIIPVGNWVYASNSTSSDMALYGLGSSGALSPLGIAATEPTTIKALFPPGIPVTSYPLDLAATADGKFVYVVYSVLGRVIGYKVGDDGKLTKVVSVQPYNPQIGVEGLAAY
jgi:6-phosphogluconolactonase (cycloisomerase 2 family)